ncbi:MAG: acyl-CoA dehydrogenase family protein, partial [Pseudomonadales bacterium]|nr:acyl-CoA dehydrogenase family protein [Pseudomonadales bacterium]
SRELGTLWHQKLFRKGWIAPSWPVAFGGTGWSETQKHIYAEEAAMAGAPMIMPFGISMVGPVIYTFGTEAQKQQHLPGILDGSVWWCQGYSEPGSGSDLASLKTRAVRDGDDFVVNGQKIWTTNAHKADWIFALVRTDPDCKPQQGISFLLIDMNSPGIERKPIVSIDGLHHLNEVYFTDVRVPVTNLIGEENKGWTYAKFLLGHERTGIAGVASGRKAVAALKAFASNETGDGKGPLAGDLAFMSRLAETEIKLNALAQIEARLLAAMEGGGSAGDAASMLKILGTEVQQSLDTLRVEACAWYALPFELAHVDGSADGSPVAPDYAFTAVSDYNFGRASSIYGGSNEIQRNVISKAVLGL